MSVKVRVKEFVESINSTVSGFEKSISVTNGYVNSISRSIGIDKIKIILEKYPNLNVEWLLTGRGDMLKSPNKEVVLEEPAVAYAKEDTGKSQALEREVELLQGRINDKDRIISMLESETNRLKTENEHLRTKTKSTKEKNKTIKNQDQVFEKGVNTGLEPYGKPKLTEESH